MAKFTFKSQSGKSTAGSHGSFGQFLLNGASACALASAFLAMPAMAQDVPAAEEEEEAIIVTGLRASATEARNIKKNAEQIVDSITAQDIGALPDRSVSEALQRIPGVTLQRTNEARDPARLAAEGGGIFIRGLSWVRSETNGRDIFSASNGRGLSFEDVSADLLAGVDVYKNPSADMIEGGVGGLVNLRTRKPLEEKGQVIAASGDYNYADLRKKGFYSGNLLYSNKWDLGGGEVGLLLSGSIGNIGNATDAVQLGRYQPQTTAQLDGAGNPVLDGNGNVILIPTGNFIPSSLGWRRIEWEQKRTSFDAVLQLRPIPEMTFTFEALYAKATPRDVEHAHGVYDLPNDNPSYEYDDDGVLISGTSPFENFDLDTRLTDQKKVTQDYSIKWQYDIDDHWAVSADVQRVSSKADIYSMTAFTEFGVAPGSFNAQRPTLSWETGGDTPNVTVTENGASLGDKSNYWWAAAMDHIERNTAGSWAQRADLEYDFDDDSFLKSFRFGVRATQKEAITRQTGYNWGLLSQQFWGSGGGAPVYLDETGSPANAGLPNQSEQYNFNNFFRGNVNMPGVGWFPTADLLANSQNSYSYLRSTETSGWGWSPLTEASYDSARPGGDNVSGGISRQHEDTKAAYALLRFGTPTVGAGTFDGNIGVRVVETDNRAVGLLTLSPLQNALTVPACVAANGAAACAALAEATAFIGAGGTLGNYQFNNKYTNVLPTLNLRYYATDDVQIRFAAGKAMVRPSFAQMVPYNTLGFSFQANGFTPSITNPRTGTGGNPFLKPTMSTQFDLSAEWYFGRSNSLTLALFYKDIKDYIFSGNSPETYTSNGTTVTFDVTRSINGEKGSVKGLELAYQQFFDFLPGPLSGLGLQANFTYVDSNGGANTAINTLDPNQTNNAADQTLPLEGLSKYSYNIAAMYEKYGISARLAYNWRSEYLLTTSAANINAPVWYEDFGQLDASLLVSVTDNIKVGVQGTNLLNSRSFLDVGGSQLHPRYSWTDTDRRIAFLVRSRF